MRCSQAKRLISEYIDGDLGPDKQKELEGHLDVCGGCREIARDFQKITQEAKHLPSLAPSPLVWQKIEAEVRRDRQKEALAEEKKASWMSLLLGPRPLRYALATLLALVIVGGGVIIGLKSWKAADAGSQGSFDFTVAKLKEAQRYYEKAIQAMSEAFQSQKSVLDPRLVDAFGENLDAMDRTIQACLQMISKDPDNLAVRAYLLTAYQEKADFLERIVEFKRAAAPQTTGTAL